MSTATRLLNDEADAQNNAGALCAAYHEYEAALDYFWLAISLSPEQREAQLNAARTLRRLQRLDEALFEGGLLEAWLEGNPGDSDARELNEEIRSGMKSGAV